MRKNIWWQGMEEKISKKYQPIRLTSFGRALDKSALFIDSLNSADDFHQISLILRSFCESFGVNRSGWWRYNNRNDKVDVPFSYNIGSAGSYYRDLSINNIDIMHHMARKGVSPVPWGLPYQNGYLHKNERNLISFYNEVGCGRGIMIHLHSHGCTLVGGFNFHMNEKDFLTMIPEFTAISHFFCASMNQAVHRILYDTQSKNEIEHKIPSLTNREIECVRWAALGKTAWEISCILSIAERTVFVHIDNAKKKLGAKTLPQAVAIAISYGIVDM